MKFEIVTTGERLNELTKDWQGPIACDTETYGKIYDIHRRLVGISLSPSGKAIAAYIPWNHFEDGNWRRYGIDNQLLMDGLRELFTKFHLVGHNFTYDKQWLADAGFETSWVGDTRVMWHMSSAPAGPKQYGLKDAQTEVLGWKNTNEEELAKNVQMKGGRLKNGDHYLADMEILAKYACLDAYSTIQLFGALKPFFDKHSYWPLLCDIMAYSELLEVNSYLGIKVDREGLGEALERLIGAREKHLKSFMKTVEPKVRELEEDWLERKCATYKRPYNVKFLRANPQKWKRFNLNSDSDKRELFYGKLNLPVLEKTEGGLPSCSADSLRLHSNSIKAMEEYLEYERTNTLICNFAEPYLANLGSDSRLHPGFNICGTVSYRLSGFKPYLLNAPFDEKAIMCHLQCDSGYIGLHADLAAIEPTITAHYSEDPALLKVFRDGLGDIYLDLALALFPNDKELQYGYRPNEPITKAIKERFAKQRKVAKIVQLAVQYTGTGHTVSRTLTREGFPTSVGEANSYVAAYWEKFKAVKDFNRRLKEINREQGLLRNIIGRIIRVPDVNYKDLSNRFIQSSAHDVLVLWVLEIYRMAKEQGIEIRPVLLDCHDSSSNSCRIEDVEKLKAIYTDALDTINKRLDLSVTIKAEMKTFQTLAGLKGTE